jgi:2-polyprenyl-3-methyl-5-hydroxy-6-metoxy-1,4-benzoquinol methylase
MNEAGKTIDKTFLSIDNAEDRGFIHRDYIAHCLRWTHVIKRLYERKTYTTARILDIGCGRELPFAKTLYSSKLAPAMYYGVDVGPILDEEVAKIAKTQKFPHKLWENTNFLELEQDDVGEREIVGHVDNEVVRNLPNLVTCFEVLEHVEPKMMFDMLEHIKQLTSPDARFFISTPCWNRVDCAANHVNEMLYESLGAGFERHGFVVENVYGTFASIRDYEDRLRDLPFELGELKMVFNKLREYYDTNFLSCIFAPLFPAQSRNCLWELRKDKLQHTPWKFPKIESIKQPWSSSTKWEDMKL